MRYEWMDEYLLAKRAVTKDLQPEWNWIRYKIGDKMFIIPGYYSNKRCWNSILPDGQVPDALLKALLDKSYDLVLKGFSKKRQREILGED